MRICLFTHTFPRFPGDTAAPFMENLAQALANLGHQVFVLVPFDSGFKLNVKRSYRLVTYRYVFPDSLHILGYSREFHSGRQLRLITYLLAPFLFLFGFLALWRLVKKEKIDIISSHWIIPSGFIAALVSLFTRVPFTTTIPGSDIYLGGKNFLFKLMVGLAARVARVVLSDNQAYLDELTKLGFHPQRTAIIRYGADERKFKPLAKDQQILKKLGLDKQNRILLAVGRLVPKKGFIYLLLAMPNILKQIPHVKLVIVGDGEQKKELLEEVNKLRINNSVFFAGTISYQELVKYYNLGDVFVMPSIRDEQGNIDASPVAMMEAMACGTPVVATKFSGSHDLVKEGLTGFLVKEKDSSGISQAVIKLLGSKSSNIKKAVRKMAVENFSTRAVAQKYTQLFKELVDGS